jgi:hypothetical protein
MTSPSGAVRPLTLGTSVVLFAAAGLVFFAGFQLFVLTEETERFFAWTVEPPLTAAFLGAAYWASCSLELIAARETEWARARVAIPAVFTFTLLTLVTTLLHRDRFHFDSADPIARTAAWLWLEIYAAVPFVLALVLLIQLRTPGSDRPRLVPLSPWLRFPVAAQAVVLLGLGVALFAVPTAVAQAWPWTLTALTGRAVGAWLIGLGVAAAQLCRENDWARIRPAAASYVIFALLQCVALARYPGEIDWGDSRAWVYVGFLVSMLAVSAGGCLDARRLWRA